MRHEVLTSSRTRLPVPLRHRSIVLSQRENSNELISHLKREVLGRVRERVPKVFRPRFIAKITSENIEEAVNEALSGVTALDIVMIEENISSFCARCGECCRRCDPIVVTVEDLKRIAAYLGTDFYIVISNNTKQLKNGIYSLRAKPCVFLKGNTCTIYPARPDVCRFFPIKTKKGYITLGLYEYCSFVANFAVQKSIGLLVQDLIDLEHPEIGRAIDEYMAELERSMPRSQAGQLAVAEQLYRRFIKPRGTTASTSPSQLMNYD